MRRKRGRIYSTMDSVLARARATKPSLPFPAKKEDWAEWRRKFRRAVVKELGRKPETVPLNAEVLERTDRGDYIREKVVYDTEPFASVPAWVLVPKGIKKGERRPALLCAHGHGGGKDDLVGLKEEREGAKDYQRMMPVQFVRRGYVTISPDWRSFGERKDPADWIRENRDGCNVAAMAVGYFGFHLLGLDIWDGMRTLDYLASRSEVDGNRIGCIGVSFGGTITTYLSALDARVKAAVISGYVSSVYDAICRMKANFCGSQFMPGLLQYGEISTVASLIAPRPLLVEMGEQDPYFRVDDALAAYGRIARAYKTVDASDRIDRDVFPGPHEFSGRKAFDWFDKWLGPVLPAAGK